MYSEAIPLLLKHVLHCREECLQKYNVILLTWLPTTCEPIEYEEA